MATTLDTDLTVLWEALEALLAQFEAPAALLCARMEVRCANQAWKEHPGREALLGARRHQAAPANPADGLRVIPLPGGGPTKAYLVLGSPELQDAGRRATALGPSWGLTSRQVQVLTEVARGRSNKEIAALLGVAEGTVESHLTLMLQRTGCANRTELVARFWGSRP